MNKILESIKEKLKKEIGKNLFCPNMCDVDYNPTETIFCRCNSVEFYNTLNKYDNFFFFENLEIYNWLIDYRWIYIDNSAIGVIERIDYLLNGNKIPERIEDRLSESDKSLIIIYKHAA